jgi:hypothetical protein
MTGFEPPDQLHGTVRIHVQIHAACFDAAGSLFPLLPPPPQHWTPLSKMPKSRSTGKKAHGSPPRSTGSVTQSRRKRTMSTVDDEAVQRKRTKTNLGEDEPSTEEKKEKKQPRKKANTR